MNSPSKPANPELKQRQLRDWIPRVLSPEKEPFNPMTVLPNIHDRRDRPLKSAAQDSPPPANSLNEFPPLVPNTPGEIPETPTQNHEAQLNNLIPPTTPHDENQDVIQISRETRNITLELASSVRSLQGLFANVASYMKQQHDTNTAHKQLIEQTTENQHQLEKRIANLEAALKTHGNPNQRNPAASFSPYHPLRCSSALPAPNLQTQPTKPPTPNHQLPRQPYSSQAASAPDSQRYTGPKPATALNNPPALHPAAPLTDEDYENAAKLLALPDVSYPNKALGFIQVTGLARKRISTLRNELSTLLHVPRSTFIDIDFKGQTTNMIIKKRDEHKLLTAFHKMKMTVTNFEPHDPSLLTPDDLKQCEQEDRAAYAKQICIQRLRSVIARIPESLRPGVQDYLDKLSQYLQEPNTPPQTPNQNTTPDLAPHQLEDGNGNNNSDDGNDSLPKTPTPEETHERNDNNIDTPDKPTQNTRKRQPTPTRQGRGGHRSVFSRRYRIYSPKTKRNRGATTPNNETHNTDDDESHQPHHHEAMLLDDLKNQYQHLPSIANIDNPNPRHEGNEMLLDNLHTQQDPLPVDDNNSTRAIPMEMAGQTHG